MRYIKYINDKLVDKVIKLRMISRALFYYFNNYYIPNKKYEPINIVYFEPGSDIKDMFVYYSEATGSIPIVINKKNSMRSIFKNIYNIIDKGRLNILIEDFNKVINNVLESKLFLELASKGYFYKYGCFRYNLRFFVISDKESFKKFLKKYSENYMIYSYLGKVIPIQGKLPKTVIISKRYRYRIDLEENIDKVIEEYIEQLIQIIIEKYLGFTLNKYNYKILKEHLKKTFICLCSLELIKKRRKKINEYIAKNIYLFYRYLLLR